MGDRKVAALIGAMLLAGAAHGQTTSKTADDIDRELASMSVDHAPGAAADGGADIGGTRAVACMFCDAPTRAKGPAALKVPAATAPRVAAYHASRPTVTMGLGQAGSAHSGSGQAQARTARPRVDMALTFPSGSDQLDRLSVPELDKYVDALGRAGQAGRRFAIEGHTNSVGAPDRNLDLSQRRARTVVNYLVAHGIDAARLEPRGLGQDDPLPGKAGADPANRRVEIKPL